MSRDRHGLRPRIDVVDHRVVGWWNEPRRHLALLLLVLPLCILSLLDPDTPGQSPRLFIALACLFTLEAWQLLFERLRGLVLRLDAAGNALNALLFCTLLPHDAPLWQSVLSLSFGIVFGELVLGGRGYTFLHPVVVALAFFAFSFAPLPNMLHWPLVTPDWVPLVLALCTFVPIAWLRRDTAFSWMAGALAICLAVLAGWIAPLGTGEVLLLGLVLLTLIADNATVPFSRVGQLALAILVVVLFLVLGATRIDGTALLFAVFAGQLCTPLIDEIVSCVWQWRHASRRDAHTDRGAEP